VATTTVTLNGSALTEAVGTAYFQHGTSTAYGASTARQGVGAAITPRAVTSTVSGLTPGTTYHFRIVAENAGGTSYGADQTFTTLPLSPSVPPVNPLPALRLLNITQSHSVWRLGRALARFARTRPPVGTRFSFTLNQQAKVTFAFTQRVAGRRVGSRCVAQTKANRRRRACRRAVVRGTLAFTGHTGGNRVSFQGRISRSKTLRPGSYTLIVTATNAAGMRSTPKQLTFTIVK
jgi:hypothetical protein